MRCQACLLLVCLQLVAVVLGSEVSEKDQVSGVADTNLHPTAADNQQDISFDKIITENIPTEGTHFQPETTEGNEDDNEDGEEEKEPIVDYKGYVCIISIFTT